MEQWIGSKLGKEHIKAVYWHPAYLTSMQNISCKILGWMNHKLDSRLPGEIRQWQWKSLVVSDSLRPQDYTVNGILQARILGWVAFSLLQGIFPTQGLNPGLLHCSWILYQLSHKGSPGEISKPQICRWYHSNGKKWRGTKVPLEEGERGELKKLA